MSTPLDLEIAKSAVSPLLFPSIAIHLSLEAMYLANTFISSGVLFSVCTLYVFPDTIQSSLPAL